MHVWAASWEKHTCKGQHIVTGSPVHVSQIYEQTVTSREWKSEMKFPFFPLSTGTL